MERSRGEIGFAAGLAALRNDQAHPYHGADPQNAARLLALLWLLSGV